MRAERSGDGFRLVLDDDEEINAYPAGWASAYDRPGRRDDGQRCYHWHGAVATLTPSFPLHVSTRTDDCDGGNRELRRYRIHADGTVERIG